MPCMKIFACVQVAWKKRKPGVNGASTTPLASLAQQTSSSNNEHSLNPLIYPHTPINSQQTSCQGTQNVSRTLLKAEEAVEEAVEEVDNHEHSILERVSTLSISVPKQLESVLLRQSVAFDGTYDIPKCQLLKQYL